MESCYKTVHFFIDLLIIFRQYYSEIVNYVTREEKQRFRTSASLAARAKRCRYWNLSTGWYPIKHGEVKEMTGVYAYTRTLSMLSVAGGVTTPDSLKHAFIHEIYVLCIAANSLLFPYRSKISDHYVVCLFARFQLHELKSLLLTVSRVQFFISIFHINSALWCLYSGAESIDSTP